MSNSVVEGESPGVDRARFLIWPMAGVCVGVLFLPWHRAFQSGVLSEGRYALLLAGIGLALYWLAATPLLDVRWWRAASLPLGLGCLALALHALDGYGALGAVVTGVSAVAWLVVSRRRSAGHSLS